MRTRFTKQLTVINDTGSPLTLSRLSQAHDLSSLADAFADAYLDTPDYYGCTPRQVRADAEVEVEMTLAGQFGRWIADASLVCQERGQPIGAILVVEWHGSPWLRHLFVRRGHRRAGQASALLGSASQTLRRQGYGQLSTFANVRNQPAVGFLAAHGFTAADFAFRPGPKTAVH